MTERIRIENIDFILVEPRHPGNVGAAARAMYNMGLDNLILAGWPEGVEARRIAFERATDGADVLERARRVATLDEALADSALAVATSSRLGEDRPPPLTREGFLEALERFTPNNRVAVVFGSERTGLRTEHLRRCTHTLVLPVARGRKSLNLAQAVLLAAYEILLGSGRPVKTDERWQGPLDQVASRAERERLYRHAVEALEATGFLTPHRPVQPLHDVCHALDRAAITSHEVRILHGILRNVLWKVKGKANEE